MIIDPGSDSGGLLNIIESKKLNVLAIINTHAHFDHIGAVSALKNDLSVPFYLHSLDEKLLGTANLYVKVFDGAGPIKIPSVDHYLDKINISDHFKDFSVNVLFTPGHTPGSVCFYMENRLFTGDTILREKTGRIDLPGGNSENLRKSLAEISKLPPATIIYPGHGADSTIEYELLHNKFLIGAIK